jgi:hypothetical protein
MRHNEDENVVEGELAFASDVAQFHTLERIQYTMPRIPRIEEQLIGYMTPFVAIMEP